jgi:hypothetical protein
VANTLLTMSMITNEALAVLENMLTFSKGVNRQYDDSFSVKGAKIGDTLNIRKPARFVGRTGQAIGIEDVTETSIPLALNMQRGVDFTFTSADMALRVDDFSDRYLKPAIANVANAIDRDGLLLARNTVYNSIGTPGTTITSALPVLSAGAKMDDNACPRDGQRSIVWNPLSQAYLVDGLKSLFNASDKISEQYNTGNMGKALGFKHSVDQNVVNQVIGPLGGTPLVNGAGQTGNSLVTNGWTAAAAARLNLGDVFTLAGVYSVNPQNRQSTGQLQVFVATSAVSSDVSGNATIPISPSITPTGVFQNVTAAPAAGAALTVIGAAGVTTPQNIAYHRDAFTLA